MADNVLEFTDDSFQGQVLDAAEPVLVDFWAPWCGPCKRMLPTIEELANDYEGRVRVGKMNTDENPNTAVAHQINAIPTVLLFKNGDIVERFVGLTDKERFAEVLDAQL